MPAPAPEVVARTALPAEIPRNASKLAELATANGWSVWTTYARGSRPTRDGYTVVDSIAVRMRREGVLVAVWHDGRFSMGGSRYRRHGLTSLRHMVALSREELAEHMTTLRAAVA